MIYKKTDIKNTNYFSIFALTISLLFYLFFAFFDGAVICVDTPSYLEMNIAREPLYPLFLAFFRGLFQNQGDFYLTAAVLVQSILAALAAWSLAMYLSREFELTKFLSLFLLFMPLAVSLLCRFAAKRGSMYSNSILTEGITISLYLLFFRYLLEYLLHQGKKTLSVCCLLVFILISTRKQMLISLVLLIACILFIHIKDRRFANGAAAAFLCLFCILFANVLLDLGYNYALRGKPARHSGDTRFVTTMVFYTAGRADSLYIPEEDIENLFLAIYDICDEKGYLKNSAKGGWLNRVSHFGDYYDNIQIDTVWPMVNEFALERSENNVVSLNKYADHIMDVIDRAILPHNLPAIIRTFADNFLSGLVTTVARLNTRLLGFSIFIYLLYLLLLVYHIQRGNWKTVLFSLLVLASIIVNVGAVSLVIFCQTRYTIYNMPLFYIALPLMINEPLARLLKGRSHAV